MSERPDWLVSGGEAVILRERAGLGFPRADTVTIERVLKRDVVLSDGSRFNADRLERSTGTWSATVRLVAPHDPRVALVRRELAENAAATQAESVYEGWRRRTASPREVAAAFLTLADLLEARDA